MNSSWALVRSDEEIDFNWRKDPPALGISVDNFSARWRQSLKFKAGVYRLLARSDDGLRVYIDDTLIIDEWHDSGGIQLYSAEATLSGSHLLQVEYYEHKGNAKVDFWWEYVGTPNEPPIAIDDTYSIFVDDPLTVTAPGVLGNDNDSYGDPLTAIPVIQPANGILVLNPDGSFAYVPDPGFSGTDSFNSKANDGRSDSSLVMVAITVNVLNELPLAVDDTYSADEDNVLNTTSSRVLGNDTDADGDPVTAILETGAANCTVILQSDGSFTYSPAPDFNGSDTFTHRASDGSVTSDIATVTITVNPLNDVPQTANDSVTAQDENPIDIGVLSNDFGLGDKPVTVAIGDLPGEGTVEVVGNQIRYTPYAASTAQIALLTL